MTPDDTSSTMPPNDLTEVQARIDSVRRRKRGTMRWKMSRTTAERAIAAIADAPERFLGGKGKSRRRKRHKRLL